MFNNTVLRNTLRIPTVVCNAGIKNYKPPIKFPEIEYPERARLKYMDKAPTYPPSLRPPKMMKNVRFMRGPEPVHNFLIHKQFGIMATRGGRLKWGHFEMIRLAILRKIDESRMFAIWRVDAPWQACTKKSPGQRMGGGKGAIDHYVTPVKAGRIIIEVGGHCEYEEVKGFLGMIAHKLPFNAIPVSQKILEEMEQKEKDLEEKNINPYTFKYIVQNNLLGCYKWISPIDKEYFGKYI